jgi:formiminotetrahydrofolate cyclodeaminase
MATATKETIYIEADDEITTVIEKIITAKNKIIAVVLPKRATVFQSVVNMKLLKKAADETKRDREA